MTTAASSDLRLENPYPGFRPFREEESFLFFGRDTHVGQLAQRLNDHRFVTVVGASGSGKSSLVRAGLIPRLKRASISDAAFYWHVVEMRPQRQPMRNLAESLTRAGIVEFGDGVSACDQTDFIQSKLRRSSAGLINLLRETPIAEGQNVLVLVDQFEQIFQYERDEPNEARRFVSLLLESARRQDLRIYVLLTMRLDHLGDCTRFRGLPEAINAAQYLPPQLTRAQLSTAITAPATMFGGMVEPEVENRILNAMASQSDQLPLMQHLMMRIWDHAAADYGGEEDDELILTSDDHDRCGGFGGPDDNALSRHADEVYETLDNGQKRTAEIMFRRLSEIVQERAVQRTASVEEVARIANVSTEQVIDVADRFRLEGRCFISPTTRDKESLEPTSDLDLSHESLIRQWRKLREWAEDEARSADDYRDLKRDAKHWSDGNGNLLKDRNLARAEKWFARGIDTIVSAPPSDSWAARYGGDFDLCESYLEKSRLAAKLRKLLKQTAYISLLCVMTAIALFFAYERAKLADALEKTYELARSDQSFSVEDPREISAVIKRLRDAADSFRKLKDWDRAAFCVSKLGRIYEEIDDPVNARIAFGEAKELWDRVDDTSSPGEYGFVLYRIADDLKWESERTAKIEELRKSISNLERASAKDDPRYEETLDKARGKLAMVLKEDARDSLAKEDYDVDFVAKTFVEAIELLIDADRGKEHVDFYFAELEPYPEVRGRVDQLLEKSEPWRRYKQGNAGS